MDNLSLAMFMTQLYLKPFKIKKKILKFLIRMNKAQKNATKKTSTENCSMTLHQVHNWQVLGYLNFTSLLNTNKMSTQPIYAIGHCRKTLEHFFSQHD